MTQVEKLTITLPADLAQEVRRIGGRERRSVSSIVAEMLRDVRAQSAIGELHDIQDFWSRKARERGILTQADLERYIRE